MRPQSSRESRGKSTIDSDNVASAASHRVGAGPGLKSSKESSELFDFERSTWQRVAGSELLRFAKDQTPTSGSRERRGWRSSEMRRPSSPSLPPSLPSLPWQAGNRGSAPPPLSRADPGPAKPYRVNKRASNREAVRFSPSVSRNAIVCLVAPGPVALRHRAKRHLPQWAVLICFLAAGAMDQRSCSGPEDCPACPPELSEEGSKGALPEHQVPPDLGRDPLALACLVLDTAAAAAGRKAPTYLP
ncbi:hypothetical protein VDGL01_07549 [Verticillium dahliae]